MEKVEPKESNLNQQDKKEPSKTKKTQKKLAKAINSIVFHEKQELESLFTNQESLKFILYHHGNGDENDYNLISIILKDNLITSFKLNLFPGISYGFLQVQDTEKENLFKFLGNCEVLLANKVKVFNYSVGKNYIKNDVTNEHSTINDGKNNKDNKKEVDKERPLFFFPSNLNLTDIKLFEQSNIQLGKYSQTEDYNVPGLIIVDEFINEEEEKVLVEEIEKREWNKLLHRQVQHYGYEFLYGKNDVEQENKIGEFPNFCSKILEKFKYVLKNNFFKDEKRSEQYNAEFYNYSPVNSNEVNQKNNCSDIQNYCTNNKSFYDQYGVFDQLTINKYSSGDGIPPHVDSHSPFHDIYCSISLLSGAVMSFSLTENKKSVIRNFYLKPRSAVFFTNEVRYEWEHSIPLRKVDLIEDNIKSRSKRISLTFRKIRNEKICNCTFKDQCDSYKKSITANQKITITDDQLVSDVPTDIEKNLVYAVYEKIAPHFSHTRYKPWPKVVDFLKTLEKFSVVGDIGCGNGKYLSAVDDLITIGTDRSTNLSKIALEKNPKSDVFVADSLNLPFKTESLDAAISIAVIHHFSNDILRLKAIKEIARCVKVGGNFLIYVWALEQDNGKFKDQDNLVAWHLQDTYKDENEVLTDVNSNSLPNVGNNSFNDETKSKANDSKGIEIKDKRAVVYHRYYHVFKEKELEALLAKVEGIEILKSYYDHENWCCICKKLK